MRVNKMSKNLEKATKQKAFLHRLQNINVNFGGVTLLGLIFAIGGCVFTFNPENKSVANLPLGIGGGMLFLHGLSMQINQTSEDMIDNLIEVIAKGE